MDLGKYLGSRSPQKKCIAPAALIGAAAISAAGSIGSSMWSQNSQSLENKTVRRWQEAMWNKTNEYNSPKNQRKLYEEAGYNPYLFGNEPNTLSGSSLPSSPSNQPLPRVENPMSGAVDAYQRGVSLLQQGQQVESNVELQRMKSLDTISDVMLKIYKEGGQKQLDSFMKDYAPFLRSLNFEGSFYEQRLKKEFLQMDIQNDMLDIERMVKNMYAKDTAKQTLENLRKSYDFMDAQISSLSAETEVSKAKLGEIASNIARNYAEAFNAKKVGDYYEVSSEQMSIINKMMSMDEQEREADFAFNTDVRKYKKQIPNRGVALGLFQGSLGAQNVSLGMESNKFLRYGKAVTSMVGDLFKVNFGISSNSTNFHNKTPQNNSQMFYSGDGYYMNNGLLLKRDW